MKSDRGVCAICRQPAIRPEDLGTVDCDRCGKYWLAPGGATELRSRANQPMNPWLKLIANANAAGYRLSIPDGTRTPLGDD